MKILYTQKRITEMVNILANQVHKANPKKDIVLVGLLDGAIYLLTDLSRQLESLETELLYRPCVYPRTTTPRNPRASSLSTAAMCVCERGDVCGGSVWCPVLINHHRPSPPP